MHFYCRRVSFGVFLPGVPPAITQHINSVSVFFLVVIEDFVYNFMFPPWTWHEFENSKNLGYINVLLSPKFEHLVINLSVTFLLFF